MGLELKYDEGQTPLDKEEKEDLKIKSIQPRKSWMNLNS